MSITSLTQSSQSYFTYSLQNTPISKAVMEEPERSSATNEESKSEIKNNTSREIVFANGTKYVGDLLNGQPHGNGTMTYNNLDLERRIKYIGAFVNGKREGLGNMTWGDRNKWGEVESIASERYNGYWKNDLFDGQGKWEIVSYNGLHTLTGIFSNGQLIEGNHEKPNKKDCKII